MKIYQRLSALLLASTMAVAAPIAVPSSAVAETVLKYVPKGEPRMLDPVVSTLIITQVHGYMVYDQLFALDQELKPKPQMVGDWSVSDDKRVYTMTLRDGLQFHDGSPVETSDVIASIERWAKRDTLGLKLVALGMKLSAVDDRTFTVSLDTGTDLVLTGFAKMSSSALFVMREEEAKTPPTESVPEIIGSGPFTFVKDEYRPGAKAVYAKFDGYVPRNEPASGLAGGKNVYVDRVEWNILTDDSTAVSALMAGEIDIYDQPPLDLVPVLRSQSNIVVAPMGELGHFGYLRPNATQYPFNNPDIRKAAVLMLNQVEALSAMAGADGENWTVCHSFFSCGGANETDAGTEWMQEQNVEKARELLEKAGYKGETVALLAPTNSNLAAFIPVVEAQLKAGGFNIETSYSDMSSMISRRTNRGTPDEGGWSLFPMWTYTFESDNPLLAAYFSMACDDTAYAGWYCSEEIEALKEKWITAKTEEVRKGLIGQIQKIMADEIPLFPLGKFTSTKAYLDKVEGLLNTPFPVFWNVKIND